MHLIASSFLQYSLDTANSGKSFGYYALHSEDLLHENTTFRYTTLSNLAAWLGSSKGISNQFKRLLTDALNLCCVQTTYINLLPSNLKQFIFSS